MAKSDSKIAIIAALIGNLLIAVCKFIGAAISGSSAMFSEGVHSLVDTGNQGLLLHSHKISQKPASERFPFGHGKEVYFWSFVVSILIFSLGGGVSLYKGISQIINPSLSVSTWINYAILISAIIFEGGACFFAFKEFWKTKGKKNMVQAINDNKDPSLIAIIFEDSAAIMGLLVALVGIVLTDYTKNPIFDGIASTIIGLLLVFVAIWLAKETKGLLIGESADPIIVNAIKGELKDHPDITNINQVLTMHLGPSDILLNMSIDFKDDLSAGELEKSISSMTNVIKKIDGRFKKVFIEAESFSKNIS